MGKGSVQVMLLLDRLEVWNPGKLPQGMTIAKLTQEHTSNPVNPVLANPVYLTGYIEQTGTGTTDIIDHCLEYGLRKPEYHQDEDFRIVIWRRGDVGVQEVSQTPANSIGDLFSSVVLLKRLYHSNLFLQPFMFHSPIWRKFDVAVGFIPKHIFQNLIIYYC